MNKSETWPDAQNACRDDGGELMCFASSLELDYWKIHCNECWSGYNRLNGKHDIKYTAQKCIPNENMFRFV